MGIAEADEGQHPFTEESLWRESLYFSFHDTAGQVSGMTTIGLRPNLSRVEGTAILFLETRRLLVYRAAFPPEEGRAGLFGVPGLAFRGLTPLQSWHCRAAADFESIDPYRPVPCPSRARDTVPAGFDFTFEAFSPAHEYPPELFGQLAGPGRHYEQNGRVQGKVTIGERSFGFTGFGFRDHSWGIRDLAKLDRAVALFAQFGPHLAVNAMWGMGGGREVSMGYLSRDGANVAIRDIQATVETDPHSSFPREVLLRIGMEDGRRLRFRAEITSLMPLVYDQGESRLYWYECLSRLRNGPDVGYGITEVTYLARN